MKLDRFQEQVFFTTVRITLPGRGTESSLGTGFLARVELNEEQSALVLVSNRHVFGDGATSIVTDFHRMGTGSFEPMLGERVTFHRPDEFSDLLIPHPNPEIDLAGFLATDIALPHHEVFWKAWRPSQIIDTDDPRLVAGQEVWFVGYPEGRFDAKHNLPILRRGSIASIPGVDFNGEPMFVIDAQVFPGSSGSPVFVKLDNAFLLVGVIAQTMIRNQKLEAVPVGEAAGVQQVIGLGLVLKSRLLTELLDHATAELRRRTAERGQLPDEQAAQTEALEEAEAS